MLSRQVMHRHPDAGTDALGSVLEVNTDISARRAAEAARDETAAALAERNTELERANQLKLDLIGMLGHEIGNPLAAIMGYSEVLTDNWADLDDGPARAGRHRHRAAGPPPGRHRARGAGHGERRGRFDQRPPRAALRPGRDRWRAGGHGQRS